MKIHVLYGRRYVTQMREIIPLALALGSTSSEIRRAPVRPVRLYDLSTGLTPTDLSGTAFTARCGVARARAASPVLASKFITTIWR